MSRYAEAESHAKPTRVEALVYGLYALAIFLFICGFGSALVYATWQWALSPLRLVC